MTHRTCAAEADILTAAAEGAPLPPAMEAHLRACPSCREQAEAVRFMRRLASAPTAARQYPDPAVVWWKAQLARRWQAERAAAAPIERMRGIELGAGLASLAAFLIWQWRGLMDMASRAIPTAIAAASEMPQAANPMAVVLLALGSASIGAVVLAVLHQRLRGSPY
jgi:hypothetical protein